MLVKHAPLGALLALVLATMWGTRWRYGGLGVADAAVQAPLVLFVAGALVAGGLALARSDRWLGVFLVYVAIRAALSPAGALPMQSALYIALGIGVLLIARKVGPHPWLIVGLVWCGIAQAEVAWYQWAGHDPYWTGLVIAGSFANRTFLGAALAMIGPLALVMDVPRWLRWSAWSAITLGILLSGSRLALGVQIISAAILFPRVWLLLPVAGLVGISLALVRGAFAHTVMIALASSGERFGLVRHGLMTWWVNGPVWGLGLNTWPLVMPTIYDRLGLSRQVGIDLVTGLTLIPSPAHNEYLQALFELGPPTLLFLALWTRDHWRTIAVSPARSAALSVAILCAGTFPFHVPALAALGCVVLGMATARRRTVDVWIVA